MDLAAYQEQVAEAAEPTGTPEQAPPVESPVAGTLPVAPTEVAEPTSTEEALAALEIPGGTQGMIDEVRTMVVESGCDASIVDELAERLRTEASLSKEAKMYKGFDEKLQTAAGLRKQYEGQDEALKAGQALGMLQQQNPEAYQQILNTFNAAMNGQPTPTAPGQQSVQPGQNGTAGQTKVSEAELQGYIEKNDISGLLNRAGELASAPLRQELQAMQQQFGQMQQFVRGNAMEQQEQRVLQANPNYESLRATVDQMRRTRPGFNRYDVETQYQKAFAENPGTQRAIATTQHRQETMPSRVAANVLAAPVVTAPGSTSLPEPTTMEGAMDNLRDSIGLPDDAFLTG